MSQARITEADYHDFAAGLRRAGDSRLTLDKSDKQAWVAWVRAHNVPEAACLAQARSKTTNHKALKLSIIVSGAWIGYYVHSAEEMVCLRFVPAQPETPAPEPVAETAAEAPTPPPTEPEAAAASDAGDAAPAEPSDPPPPAADPEQPPS